MAPVDDIRKSTVYNSDGPPAFIKVFLDSSDAVIVTNDSWDIVFVNQRATSLSGYSSEEIINRKITDYFDREQGLPAATAFGQLEASGSVNLPFSVKRINGVLINVNVNACALNADYFLFIVKDLTANQLSKTENSTTASMLSAAFDHSPFGMALLSPEGKWLKANQSFCTITGYSEEELFRMKLSDITCTNDFAGIEAMLLELTTGNANSSFSENRYQHKNGAVVWVNVYTSLLWDADQKPLFFVLQAEDITQKKQIEKQLLENKSLLQLFVKHSPAALAMFDTDMRYMVVSEQYLKDYHLEGKEVLGKSHYEVFPNIPAQWKEVHRKCMKGVQAKKDGDRFVLENGNIDWLNWEMMPWYNAEGNIGGAILYTQMITEQKEAELKFRNLAEKSQVGVYIIQDDRFVYVNPRFAEIFGYTQNEMEGMVTERIVDKSEREKVDRNIKARIEGEVDYVHYETIGVKKDGSRVYTEAYGSHTVYKGSSAVIGSLLDITERKNAEQQSRQKTEQLAAISNNLPDVVIYQVVCDAEENMRFTYLSEGVRKLTGMSPEETMTHPEILYHIIHEEDIEKVRSEEKKSFHNLTLFNIDVRMNLFYGEERLMNMRSTPQRQADGSVVWNGLVTDITDRKKAQEDILALSRLYLLKSKVNELLLTTTDKEAIFSSLCEIAVTYGNFRMAWIGYFDPEERKIIPYNAAGYDNGYLDRVRANPLKHSADGNTPIGRALRTGMAQCSNDIANDPDLSFWKEEALQRNFLSSAAIPVKVNNETVAVLALYMPQTCFFTEAEMGVLQNITQSIAFGLDKIRVDEEKKRAEAGLIENIQINRAMIAAFPDKVLRIRRDGTIVYIHSGNETALYLPAEQMMSRKVESIAPDEVAVQIMLSIERSLQEKAVKQLEYTLLQNGRLHYYEGRVAPIEIPGEEQVLFIARDITDEKNAEAALKASEEKFRTLIEKTQLGVYILQDGEMQFANPVLEKIVGYSIEEMVGRMSIHDLVHPDDRGRVEENIRIRISGKIPNDIRPIHVVRKDGAVILLDTIASLIVYEGRPAIIGTAIDITDKVAEEERLAKAVSDAQEKERQQIGMELHDNVKQLLVASDMRLGFIQKKLDERQKVEEHLQVARDIITKAINDLRDISHQLTPIIEGGLPLDQSIALLVKRMDLHSMMDIDIRCDESVKILSKEVHLAFYRILQEQLNNIIKYAKAQLLSISVEDKRNHICMRVVDDGRGFDTSQKVEGIGFENMRRRIKLLHGQLTILSAPGKGCEVDIRIPKQ